MRKIVQLVFWLSLILIMMPLLGCSTAACSSDCLPFPKGGKPMGDVYRKLPPEDKKTANEYFNRLYKFSQLPVFCKMNGDNR